MPYKNREQQNAYKRDWARLRRAGEGGTPRGTVVPLEFRLETARDVLDLLAEQIGIVRDDADAGKLEKARCIGGLLTVALKAIESGDMAARVEVLEQLLKQRKEPNENGRN